VTGRDGKARGPSTEQALSHPVRLELLDCIGQRGTGMDEGELAELLGIPLVKVRYHLTILHDADLVAHPDRSPDRYVVTAAA